MLSASLLEPEVSIAFARRRDGVKVSKNEKAEDQQRI